MQRDFNPQSNFKPKSRWLPNGEEWEGKLLSHSAAPAAAGCAASAGTEVTCPLRHSALCWPYGSMWASELTFIKLLTASLCCGRIIFHFNSSHVLSPLLLRVQQLRTVFLSFIILTGKTISINHIQHFKKKFLFKNEDSTTVKIQHTYLFIFSILRIPFKILFDFTISFLRQTQIHTIIHTKI